jgi:DNA-binding CsgD family transcriptional regulator
MGISRDLPEFTPLEQEVLPLIAEHRTNELIRLRLGLNDYQLARALTSIYRKTGVHRPKEAFIPSETRQALVEWALDYFDHQGRQ